MWGGMGFRREENLTACIVVFIVVVVVVERVNK
jgi:hypothetical protein